MTSPGSYSDLHSGFKPLFFPSWVLLQAAKPIVGDGEGLTSPFPLLVLPLSIIPPQAWSFKGQERKGEGWERLPCQILSWLADCVLWAWHMLSPDSLEALLDSLLGTADCRPHVSTLAAFQGPSPLSAEVPWLFWIGISFIYLLGVSLLKCPPDCPPVT